MRCSFSPSVNAHIGKCSLFSFQMNVLISQRDEMERHCTVWRDTLGARQYVETLSHILNRDAEATDLVDALLRLSFTLTVLSISLNSRCSWRLRVLTATCHTVYGSLSGLLSEPDDRFESRLPDSLSRAVASERGLTMREWTLLTEFYASAIAIAIKELRLTAREHNAVCAATSLETVSFAQMDISQALDLTESLLARIEAERNFAIGLRMTPWNQQRSLTGSNEAAAFQNLPLMIKCQRWDIWGLMRYGVAICQSFHLLENLEPPPPYTP